MATRARAEVEITGKDKTAKGFRSAQNSLRKFAQRAKRVVLGITAGILTLGAAFAGIGSKLFELGSDALETQSKFESVFGASTQAVNDFAENFRKVAGVTRSETQAILANTGAIAQGLGFTTDASAELAATVVTLGGDLASFNNVEGGTVAATEAVNAALVGQTERLRSMGIVLLATDIQQRALANTGRTVVSELTKQEKATAALELITERAGAAVGDLARTQGSAANQAKQVRAEFRQLTEDLAISLIPVLIEFIPIFRRLSERLQEILPQLTDFFVTLGDMVGLTNAAVREEVEAVERAGLTVEQIEARRERIANENVNRAVELINLQEQLARVSTEGFRGTREELFALREQEKLLIEEITEHRDIEVALQGVIDKRLASEAAATLQVTERAKAETEAARARLISEQEAAARGVRAPPTPELAIRPGLEGIERVTVPELPEGVQATTDALLGFKIGFFEATEQMVEFMGAAQGVDELLGNLAGRTLVNFQAGFVEAFEAIGAGDKVFSTLGKAIKRSLADAATAEAKVEVARGVAAIAAGLFPPNPAAFASAAQHFAAAALFGAAAGALGGVRTAQPGGGGVGGRGPISEESIQQVQGVGGVAPSTLIIQGALLDTSDPRQADALADAISDISGRRVLVSGG